MARRKGGKRTGTRRQGIVSWLTSIFALLIGLGPLLGVLKDMLAGASPADAASQLNKFYNPLAGDRASLAVGYGSLVGGIIFKVATSELAKRARVRSIIPALHA